MEALKRRARLIGTGAEVALGVAMAAAVAGDALITSRADRGWPLGLWVGAMICVAALLRRRNRAWAAAAGLVLFATTGLAIALGAVHPLDPAFGGGLAGLLVLAAATARTLPPRQAVLIGVVGVAVVAVSETAGPTGLFDRRALHALVAATLWAAALAVGVYFRYLDFIQGQMLETARRQERFDLARELHDVVAHHVTGIVVQAQAARFAGTDQLETLRSALSSIENAGADTLAAIRQIVGLLRDPDDPGSVPSRPEPIGQLVARFARHGPAVDLRGPADLPADWPPEVASTVYRVVQEALTNIARHAPAASSVTVALAHDPGQVRVEVIDDAPALGPASRSPRPGDGGYGLVGMTERVEALGGKLLAGPLPGAGWAVRASLPIPAHGLT